MKKMWSILQSHEFKCFEMLQRYLNYLGSESFLINVLDQLISQPFNHGFNNHDVGRDISEKGDFN